MLWHVATTTMTAVFICVCTTFSYLHLGIVAVADRHPCGRRQQQGVGRGRGLCLVRLSGRWAPGAVMGGSETPLETGVPAWSALTHTWTDKGDGMVEWWNHFQL